MKLYEKNLLAEVELFSNPPLIQNKLPLTGILHRLFVSALYFKNKSCLKRLLQLDNKFQPYITHYKEYYIKKKELRVIIRSLKFAIKYALKRYEKNKFL